MTLDVTALYAQHKPLVERFVRRRVRPDDVDDIVSETFLRAVRSSHQYRDLGYQPQSWLLGIARNLITDHRRRYFSPTWGGANEARLTDLMAERKATLDAGSPRHIDAIALGSAMTTLTPLQQNVVALRYLDGTPVADTSALLGVGEEGVKKLAWRGLANMRRALRETA